MRTDDHSAASQSDTYRTDPATILYPLLNRWWYDPIARRIPLWVPANALTVAAAAALILSFVVCLVVARNPPLGRLVGLVGALYWIYHTLDNVDGSHARRTGTSGPAGEFLDHGSDVMTCSLPALGISLALNLPPALILAVTSIVALSLWATLWCMYYTGVFVMRPVSDSEAAVAVTLVLFAGGLVGREPLVAPLGQAGVSVASLLAISVGLAFGRQFYVSLTRPDAAVSRWPALPLVASHLLLVTWYFLARGAVSIIAIGILLALAAGRAGQRILLARLLGLPVPSVDWLALFLSCVGPGTLLLGVLVAEMQAVLAWSLIAVAGPLQVAIFVRSFVELRRQQSEGHPHVG